MRDITSDLHEIKPCRSNVSLYIRLDRFAICTILVIGLGYLS